MNLIVFALRRPCTALMLVVLLANGGVLGAPKVWADHLTPLKAREVYADPGLIGMRAKPVSGYIVGRLESYFHKQKEQPDQGHQKIVATSPKAMDVTLTQRYVCEIRAQRHIIVRALENGSLEAISVKDGQAVKRGDVMFKIVTAGARANADLAQAESDFTDVIAPFDGIVGRVHEQLHGPIKERDILTTLSDNSAMRVYFNVPEAQYFEYMANRKQHEEDKIELVLANQTKFPQPGKISAIAAEFNKVTGNIAFRVDFPNLDGRLYHGQTGSILIHRNLHDATVIPMRATYEILDTQYVYVVDKDDVVHRREIVAQHEMDDISVIKKGVGVGDRIVVEGVRKVRDGEKVEYEFRPLEEVMGKPKNHDDKIVVTSLMAIDVTVTERYVCQIRSLRHINVRALESGSLEAISVKYGQAVKKGDVMFKIARTGHQAKLDAETAGAKLAHAQAKASLAKAELNFTNVIAPFDGILGRLHEPLGSLINEGDVLTSLSDNSVVWVYFNVPEKQYLEYMANRKQHEEDKIELVLANQTKFPQPGKINAIQAQFNNRTGTVPFRADFPNPDGLLRHNQTGTVLIHRTLKNALVIPQRAVLDHLAKRYVYVVDKDDVVHERAIVVQNEMDDIFVIKKGLDVNDRIVLDGVRQVRDGEKVEYEFRPPEEVMGKLKNHAE